jgi:class 3 adenylate cyclase
MRHQDRLFEAIDLALSQGWDLRQLESELWERFGQQAAVLVMDSTGFTRTTQSKGIAYFLTALCRMRNLTRPLLQQQAALFVQPEADNIFAAFEQVDQAVAGALAIHQALDQERIPLQGRDWLQASIGIGYGRLLRSDREGFFGDEMNLASKLGEDTAEGGETLLTSAAWDQLNRDSVELLEERDLIVSGVTITAYSVRSLA